MPEDRAASTPVTLPDVLAGPILRRLTDTHIALWLATSRSLELHLELYTDADALLTDYPLDAGERSELRLGEHLYLQLIEVALPEALAEESSLFAYDLNILGGEDPGRIAGWGAELLYEGERRPRVKRSLRFDTLLHGSCRKPHHPAADGLARADRWLAERRDDHAQWPAALIHSGDQVYVDDVSGVTLAAIHALISRLGLDHERFEGATIDDSRELMPNGDVACHRCSYYHRERLLPHSREGHNLRQRFFGGTRKPVFTSDNASNHLISLAEMIAMYLLVWSPVPWRLIDPTPPTLAQEDLAKYRKDEPVLARFVHELTGVRRVLAHLPNYMIFDDHDVSDDWNLTGAWEKLTYEHPFSKRIIGNALLAYLLFQGWGNAPESFDDELLDAFTHTDRFDEATQDALIERLLHFDRWQYEVKGEPKLLVLDTRTQRWKSERNPDHPSGLMDWEALTETQQALLGNDAVVMVSPAPIFGVKLIETIQQAFTWIGKPLLVDAENWMAHPGCANVILNIFYHRGTPKNFVVLSGDVHYSFVYDINLRGRDAAPSVWQITSSGIKNEFPDRLLDTFDRLNRWLYAPWSPLNLFTQRRRFEVRPRLPDHRSTGERLVNKAGIGLVRLDAEGRPIDIRQLGADGEDVRFESP
ncbi:alkaline phosphatase D family protein [Halotalea alkalilenta]|uniref:alkaline phosphatase D family protein n=1 Tax=Halotalea alkalilenta TaxID=376489 RepID=UPI000AF31AC0|nr:alkaline phosphatase D family protein [Halotalea alkalilenta]